jgi:sugar O-acyltransferase (sialic acid O-acetyltransferase NeuD family)
MFEFVLWGATGQAIVIEELLRNQNSKIVALFDNNYAVKSPFKEIPIFYGEEGFNEWYLMQGNKRPNFLITIGGAHGDARESIFRFLELKNLSPKTVKHTTAFIAENSHLGRGCQILANSSICAKAILGNSVIINTGAIVDHDSIVEDFVHVAPGATICGQVKIGKKSFIGANATILPRLTIGENSIIGAGSVVTKNIPDNVVAYGSPAKVISRNKI